MARARYKIGTFVKVAETQDRAAFYGAVEEVHLTQRGNEYTLTSTQERVNETEVEAAFRAITPRKPKAVKAVKSKKVAA